ncbi:hypothetical protein [Nonomuraea africana]|uniref:Uncharacterized protein n=1 Tax=Nonomuraea africana TaxID=46171 RepID=A0ABR9KAQ6_9ACTN|nr:hypothetical protein [Nonomuraea africana]MBE1559098.1 hypothetical protein [Nonomuraea africana]
MRTNTSLMMLAAIAGLTGAAPAENLTTAAARVSSFPRIGRRR